MLLVAFCHKALKALALLRSGKAPEGEVLLKEIMQAQPADDPTLQAMTICYREMQKRKTLTIFFKGPKFLIPCIFCIFVLINYIVPLVSLSY